MSKKSIIGPLLIANMLAGEYNMWEPSSLNQKQLEGSPIYIPKRHKFKKRNKR